MAGCAALVAALGLLAAAGSARGEPAGDLVPVPDGAALTPAEVLQLAAIARAAHPAVYREIELRMLPRETEAVSRRVFWLPPDALRVEEEDARGRRVAVWNGVERWYFDSRFPYVLHVRVPGRMPPPPPRLPAAHPDDACSLTETWGPGGHMYVVEHPRRHGRSVYWIDGEHFFPWKEEHYGPGRELLGVVVRSDLDMNPALTRDRFRFEVPPGAEVLEDPRVWRARVILHGLAGQVPFPPAEPGYVPSGYSLAGGGPTRIEGEPALHLRFSDGRRLLSLFQVPRDGLPEARPGWRRVTDARGEEVLVLTAVRDGFVFLVVGDLAPGDAQRMVDTLKLAGD